MTGARVRRATPADVAVLVDLITELAAYERARSEVVVTADMLGKALFGGTPAVFAHVAVVPAPDGGEEVVGLAVWFVTFSTWLGRHGIYLEDLYVRPAARGRGLGKALLRALAQVCMEEGYGRLEWSVLDWNSPAIGFYSSLDAVPMEEWTVYRLAGPALSELGGNLGAPNPITA